MWVCLLSNTITLEPFEKPSRNLYGSKTMVKNSDGFENTVGYKLCLLVHKNDVRRACS